MRLKSIGSMSNRFLASTRPLFFIGHGRIVHRRYSTEILPNKGGLFGLGTVRSTIDFRRLTDHVYEKGRSLLAEALSGRQRKRKLVVVLDELSDTICQAADMAECIRTVHPRSSFADEAEQCVSQLSQFVESLNSNRELYLTLRRSVESNDADSACRESMDDVDRRVMALLIDDMETSGVHLPDAQRLEFVEYNSGIFAVGAEFVRAAHEFKTVRHVRAMTSDDFLRRQKDRLKSLLTLRHRLARLVGYQSYAERAIRGSFLETPTKVHQFLKTLVDELKTKKLLDNVIAQSAPSDTVEAEKKRRELAAKGDTEQLDSATLSLSQLIGDKINSIAGQLLDLRFEKQEPKKDEIWHPSVTKLVAYNLNEPTRPLGVVYCDWYDRDRKGGDAHYTVRCGRELHPSSSQGGTSDHYQTPIVVLTFRLPPPKECKNGEATSDYWLSPLVFNGMQIETILHEFGHALHTLVGRTRYQHVSGTRCSTDLAEIPSTFLEHYVLDEKVAQALWGNSFERHRAFTRTNGITEMLNQSFYALADLELHTVDPEQVFVEEISASIAKELELPLASEDRLLVFEHLVPYGAKYHAYIVAKALAAIVWRRGGFPEKPLERQSGDVYRRLLSFGGEKYPRELIQLTAGEVPSVQALAKSLAEDVAGNLEQQRAARHKRLLE